jgi:DNA-binding PadR family transcriptional regulator
MPRKKSGLTPAEYAILGLVHQRPAHGYQIAQEMAPDSGLGLICPLRRSNVYFLLGNLERRGLIEVEQRRDDAYPPKTVLKATAAGRRAFETWIWQPVTRLREVRLDFLLKAYFLSDAEPESIVRLLEGQVEFCRRYLGEWQALADGAAPQSFDRVVIEAKLAAAQGTLDWLLDYRRQLEEQATAGRPAGEGERR